MYTNISKSTIILSGIPLYIRDSDDRYRQPSKLHYKLCNTTLTTPITAMTYM